MDIGLSVWLDRPAEDCSHIAVAAEYIGFSTVWVPDHYFLRDLFIALGLAATRTNTIRLGAAVASPLLRHPALLASSFATLNELSGGRAVVGIGTGGAEFPSQLGLEINQPLAVVRESVAIVKALSTGPARVKGRIFTTEGAELGWSTGAMPIYLAARGPRMLELAGAIADGVITHGLAPTHIAYARQRVSDGADRAARPESACVLCVMFDYEFDEDREAALDRLKRRCLFMVGGSYAEELIPLYGLDPEQVRPIREAVRTGDHRKAVQLMTPGMVQAFAVAGTPQELTDELQTLSNRGVEAVILSLGGATLEETMTNVDRVGRALFR
ncbi:MAG: LLM class flavin-dependent oxidoreductase [Actinomycetota bacterium]